MSQTSSPARLAAVRSRIAAAAAADKRAADAVTLIAVSKTFGPEHIRPVLEAGQRVFGENRVQEAKAKWPQLRQDFAGIALHLIGPLQSNTAKEAVLLFDAIHSIDRPKIAEAVAEAMLKQGRRLQLFIEVNTGEEPQKAGVLPRATGDLLRICREELELDIAGLMCIPPFAENPEEARPHFRRLRELREALTKQLGRGLPVLSMGMSHDFEVAIEEGATEVRVGTALFGTRGTK